MDSVVCWEAMKGRVSNSLGKNVLRHANKLSNIPLHVNLAILRPWTKTLFKSVSAFHSVSFFLQNCSPYWFSLYVLLFWLLRTVVWIKFFLPPSETFLLKHQSFFSFWNSYIWLMMFQCGVVHEIMKNIAFCFLEGLDELLNWLCLHNRVQKQ